MKSFIIAVFAVIGIAFVKGELGYLVALACCCYIIFDVVFGYAESSQKKMEEQMHALAKKLSVSVEDLGLEDSSDQAEPNQETESQEQTVDAFVNPDQPEAQNTPETPAEDEETPAPPTQSEDSGSAALGETTAQAGDADTSTSQAEPEVTTESQAILREKYKHLSGKELEFAIAKDKINSVVNSFEHSAPSSEAPSEAESTQNKSA